MSTDSNIEGSEFYPKSKEELTRAVDSVFAYRGYVTLVLKSGNEFVGYVYSRQDHVPEPYLEMFVANQDRPQRIPIVKLSRYFFQEKIRLLENLGKRGFRKKGSDRKKDMTYLHFLFLDPPNRVG